MLVRKFEKPREAVDIMVSTKASRQNQQMSLFTPPRLSFEKRQKNKSAVEELTQRS